MYRGFDLLEPIRHRVNDIDANNYTDDEILSVINSAIRLLSKILIARKSPEMIAADTVADGQPVPEGFYALVGQYPVWREGLVLRTSTGRVAVPIRYWCEKGTIKALDEYIPYPEDYADAIIEASVARLLLTDEFDATAEQALAERVCTLLPGEAQ